MVPAFPFSTTQRLMTTTLFGAALLLATPSPTMAITPPFKEEKVSLSVPAEEVKGRTIKFDQQFAARHGTAVPDSPFSLVLPKSDQMLMQPAPEQAQGKLFVTFTLPDTTGKIAAEKLQLMQIAALPAPREERLEKLTDFIREKVYPRLMQGYDQIERQAFFTTKINGVDAISLHLQMRDRDSEKVYLGKIIAIIPEDKIAGVLAFLVADKELSEIQSEPDLSTKGLCLQIIHSLQFLDPAPTEAPNPATPQ